MMKSLKASRRAIPFLTLALSLFIVVALGTTQALAAWKPTRPIEFVIMAGKGGGADRIARLMQKIVTQNKWSPQPLVPINKKGGSGAEAMLYLLSKKGNPHVILVTLNSFFTTPALRKLPVNYTKLTPVYRLAMDTFLLWVNTKSGIKNMDDFVKAVKAKKGKWTMGGTGKMQEDQLVTNMLMQAYGLKGMITYVPFRGGGTVAKNLAGGHVDSTVNNPSEGLPHYPGKMRPIAALTPERISAFKEVPDFQGTRPAAARVFHAAQHQRARRHLQGRSGMVYEPVQQAVQFQGVEGLHVQEGAQPRLPERRAARQVLRR